MVFVLILSQTSRCAVLCQCQFRHQHSNKSTLSLKMRWYVCSTCASVTIHVSAVPLTVGNEDTVVGFRQDSVTGVPAPVVVRVM